MIYALTGQPDFSRDFALRDQIRRASVSVSSNIAEAYASRTRKLFIDLLGRAKGSAGEVRSQLYIALDCEYIHEADFRGAYRLADKAGRQIHHLIQHLERSPNRTSR